jgi:hypothetical protein
VRKGKLYYLRGTSGKASKIKEHIGPKGTESNHTVAEASNEVNPAT